MDSNILQKAKAWLNPPYDESCRKEVKNMIENNPQELTEAFYKDLEFGTGGLRGIIGLGSNRMNRYTVAMATQGFANYLRRVKGEKSMSVAIAYDCRNFSPEFARVAADVFSANGMRVFLFDSMRPTPELSFAVRYLQCDAGVMITASHNPKEYNGYKAYWEDGGQLVPPHDFGVMEEVQKISSLSEVKMQADESYIKIIDNDIDIAYLEKIKSLQLSPEAVREKRDLKMIFTPLHGTGMTMIPRLFKELGYTHLSVVDSQMIADGNFPTVKSPNPEEKEALSLAIEQAKREGAELVMATDPDSDRVGLALRNEKGDYVLLNGNQTASLLVYYLINLWKVKGKINGKQYIVKTIVTSELLKEIAEKNGVASYDVLTGFKYIAEIIRQKEGKEEFIGGGEESYGYLVGDFVRDKDAVIACMFIAEMAAYAAMEKKSLLDLLKDLYRTYGFYKEDLVSLSKKGKSGLEEIKEMMQAYRTKPPREINGLAVVKMYDYKTGRMQDFVNGKSFEISMPSSDVLQFFTEDGSKITVRPSGTEPKIKFYFGLKQAYDESLSFQEQDRVLSLKLAGIQKSLNIL